MPDTKVLVQVLDVVDGVPDSVVFTAETRTDSNGGFVFHLFPPIELAAVAGRNGGVVSFVVSSVLADGKVARWGFPRRLEGDQWSGSVPRITVEPLGVTFD